MQLKMNYLNCWHRDSELLSPLTSINRGLCPMAAIPCSAFTSATRTLCSSCEENSRPSLTRQRKSKHETKMKQHNREKTMKPTLTLHTVCPCSLTCSQLEITCSIWVRSKKSSCSSSGISWLKSMASSTLSNFLRTEGIEHGRDERKSQTESVIILNNNLKWQLDKLLKLVKKYFECILLASFVLNVY